MQNNSKSPPRWATRLLHWYCPAQLLEEVEGDLKEEFDHQLMRFGEKQANLDYIRNVIGLIRPILKRKKTIPVTPLIHINMFRHYLTVAFRNLLRQKSLSGINIIGLALGMTCCLFIYLWVEDEKGVDDFHANGKTLFNVYQTNTSRVQTNGSYSTPFALLYGGVRTSLPLSEFQKVIPEIEKINFYATGYELPWGHPETFQVGDKIQKFEGSRTGKDFFSMFSYPILAGSAQASLHDISSISISRKMAAFFFETPQNAIGKSLRFENKLDFIVNAVFEDVTPKSSLKFDFLINWESQMKQLDWATGVVLTTLQLSEKANIAQVENRLNRFLQSRLDKSNPEKVSLGLRPYHNRYLFSTFVNGKPAEGRIEYLRIFTGVAIFILIIACINFMNLATARSVKRAKEVGVRKVIGSTRASLVTQFLGESFLLSFLALLISVLLIQILLPFFNDLTGKQIASPMSVFSYWLVLITLALFTGFAAGSYPALYLSSLRPARILKGMIKFSGTAIWFRKGLVCFQFALSIALLIAMLVISHQTRYVQEKNLGYDRQNLIYIQIEGQLNPKYALFKERALGMPGIAMIDRSTEAPHAMNFIVDDTDGIAETNTGDDAIQWEGKEKNAAVGFKPSSVGFDFVKIMNLKLAEGRDFSRSFATDSADAFMINEEAVKQMGMKDPIGKWVSAWAKKGHIVGILKDYHTNSLREPIKPLIIDVKEYEYFGVIIIRTEPGKTKEALASLATVCQEINPNYPFGFKFLDQEYGMMYRNEQIITKLTNLFAMLGIVISCLGLLGLVMLASEQRTKEIGIRKVLGATVTNIVQLLSREFIVLVLFAFIVSAPVAGYFMNQWLNTFAYKIDLSWWIFGLAGVMAILIALITISIQAIQSAIENPVRSLRAE